MAQLSHTPSSRAQLDLCPLGMLGHRLELSAPPRTQAGVVMLNSGFDLQNDLAAARPNPSMQSLQALQDDKVTVQKRQNRKHWNGWV